MTPSRPNQKAARSARKQAWRFIPSLFTFEDRLVPTTTLNVNTTDDPQLIPTFKLPLQPGATTVSLRSAVEQVNVGTTDNDVVINLPVGNYNILLPQDPTFVPSGTSAATLFHPNRTGGAFTLNPRNATNVVFQGAGAGSTVVDAQGLDRVFNLIAPQQDLSVTFNNLTIRNGFAGTFALPSTPAPPAGLLTGAGGGILFNDLGFSRNANSLTLNSVAVQTNGAAEAGGGIMAYNASISLSASSVQHNVSASIGGGIADYTGDFSITNGLITDNVAGSDGGGLHLADDLAGTAGSPLAVTITIDNSAINSNAATFQGAGGGLYDVNGPGGRLSIQNGSSISGNTARFDGGGMEVEDGTVSVTNSTLNSNHSGEDGGAIDYDASSGGSLNLVNNQINGNTAGSDGGGINNDSFGSNVNIAQTIFGNNVADGGFGGAISDPASTNFKLTGVQNGNPDIFDNAAFGGGGGGIAISSSNGTYLINGVNMAGNRAGGASSGGVGGGAIYNPSGSSFTLQNSTINGNIAPSGGGVQSQASTIQLASDVVTNNIATQGNGGGFDNDLPSSTGTLTAMNTLFQGNVAAGNGGGVYTAANNATFDTFTALGNTSAENGGGLDYNGSSSLLIKNDSPGANANTISNNVAAFGAGVSVETTNATATIKETNFVGNHASQNGGAINYTTGTSNTNAAGILDVDHAFITANTSGLQGGGIWTDAAKNVIVFNTITNNKTTSGGGGIDLEANQGTTPAPQNSNISNNYIANNFAGGGGDGGGILNRTGSGSYTEIVNDTIFGNTAGRFGGGIAAETQGQTDGLFLTVDNNTAGRGGGIYSSSPASSPTTGVRPGTAFNDFALGNSIVVHNFAAPDPVVPLTPYVNLGGNGYALYGGFTDIMTAPPAVLGGGTTAPLSGIVGRNYIDPQALPPAVDFSGLGAAGADTIIFFNNFNNPPSSSYLAAPAFNGGPTLPFGFFSQAIQPNSSMDGDAIINLVVLNFFGGTSGTVIDQVGNLRPLAGPPYSIPPDVAVDRGALESVT